MFGAFFWERGWGLTLLTSLLPRAVLFLLLLSDLFQSLCSDGHAQLKFQRLEVKPSLEEDNRRERRRGRRCSGVTPPRRWRATSASTLQKDVWCIKFNSTAANCRRSRAPRGWLPSPALPANGTTAAALHPAGPAASRNAPSRGPPGPPPVRSAQRFHPNPVSGPWNLCPVVVRRLRHREGTKVTSCEEVRDDTTTAKPKTSSTHDATNLRWRQKAACPGKCRSTLDL